jgi:hypothetical protein
MQKWIAIRVSATLTILGSAATLLFAGLMVMAGFFAPPPPAAAESPAPFKGMMAALAVFFTALSVWGLLTGIAIFRRRGWARLSMVIFAVLLVGMGGSALLGILFIRLPQNPSVSPQMMLAIRLGIAAFYGALAVTGAWWLLLFNSSRGKQYFAEPQPAAEEGRPLSISIIAWYLLAGTVFAAAAAILRVPGMFFGVLLTGWAALGVYTAFAAVNLYLGSGLLQLQEPARIGSIVYFAIVGLNGAVTFLLPGFDGRMRAMQEAFPRFLRWSQQQSLPIEGWGFALIGTVFSAVPIWFLVRRRAAFRQA